MDAEQELPHAAAVLAWASGEPIPPRVKTIFDWLLATFPLGPPLEAAEHDTFAAKAHAERWHPDDIEPAMLFWHLVTEQDETDKPAA